MQNGSYRSKIAIIRVSDDGMSEDRIMKGDLVAVDEEACFEDGRIMLVMYSGELIVRRIFEIKYSFVAIPSNPKWKAAVLPKSETWIMGTVVRVHYNKFYN